MAALVVNFVLSGKCLHTFSQLRLGRIKITLLSVPRGGTSNKTINYFTINIFFTSTKSLVTIL